MQMSRLSSARKGLLALALLAGAGFISACEDIDWDWETRWWVKPTRQVRPNRVVSSSSGTAAPAPPKPAKPLTPPPPPPSARPPPAPAQPPPAPPEKIPAIPERARPPEPVPEPPPERPEVAPPASADSFYQLYLISEPASLRSSPN